MGYLVTANYDDLFIEVMIKTEDNMKYWIYYNINMDLYCSE